MSLALDIKDLSKVYEGGHQALDKINLEIKSGEIFALLGPNGAGKTTLIGSICGIVNPSSGQILVNGHNIQTDFRITRSIIGLVPQELTTDAFETVWDTVSFSRGLFGKPKNPAYIEKVLKSLSLFEKKDQKILTLSGGMKRRVLIAKALSHEPQILFLDEPTAGVDVELRNGMWEQIRELRDQGVTVLLTTHYIQEAEEMADRIGIINQGKLILVDEKTSLIQRLGRKEIQLYLQDALSAVPPELSKFELELDRTTSSLKYTYNANENKLQVASLLKSLDQCGLTIKDISTRQSSLEEIFVSLVSSK